MVEIIESKSQAALQSMLGIESFSYVVSIAERDQGLGPMPSLKKRSVQSALQRQARLQIVRATHKGNAVLSLPDCEGVVKGSSPENGNAIVD